MLCGPGKADFEMSDMDRNAHELNNRIRVLLFEFVKFDFGGTSRKREDEVNVNGKVGNAKRLHVIDSSPNSK